MEIEAEIIIGGRTGSIEIIQKRFHIYKITCEIFYGLSTARHAIANILQDI